MEFAPFLAIHIIEPLMASSTVSMGHVNINLWLIALVTPLVFVLRMMQDPLNHRLGPKPLRSR